MKSLPFALGCSLLLTGALPCLAQTADLSSVAPLSALTGTSDVGLTIHGASEHQPGSMTYRLSGGGGDVNGTTDAFRFTWARIAGDGGLTADVHIEAPVANRLAKGMLLFRQSLYADSAYVGLSVRADGHVVLQYRAEQGGTTRSVELAENNLTHLRLVREGSRFTAFAASPGGERSATRPVSVTVPLHGSLYVGLGVCSHNDSVLQNATFSEVTAAGTLY